jgi:ATP-binding cassette subfamily F protein 3
MLRLIDVAVARGARTLYRGVSLIAPPGERIGLVGANGSGKSTLFAAILGELGIDAGTIEAPPPARIAHVAQDIDAVNQPALDYVVGGRPAAARRADESPGPRFRRLAGILAQAAAGDRARDLARSRIP